jgi:N-acetyl-anhydromuramyl-L-alanine amidase AmpD
LAAYNSTNDAKKQEALVKKILSENDKATQEATAQQAYSTVEDRIIDTQSIYNVMTRLAGDCAYILGYILEGGIAGFNKDATRLTNNQIFGNYYPLVENTGDDKNSTLGAQSPYKNATIELKQVEQFVKSLYTGRQYADKVIEESTQEETGGVDDATPAQPVAIKRKISNLELRGNSPYYATSDSIIVNIIQRSGLIAAGFAGKYYNVNNTNHAIDEIVNSEVENIVEHVNALKGTQKETLKNFCTVINENFTLTGEFKNNKNWNSATSVGPSIRDFIAQYFNKFPKATTEKGQFSGSDYKSLKSTYTYNNDILYHSPRNLKNALKNAALGTSKQTNDILSDPYGEVLGYLSSPTSLTLLENLYNVNDKGNFDTTNTTFNTFDADPTIPYNQEANYFFQVFKATGRTSNSLEKCIFIDVEKMFGEKKVVVAATADSPEVYNYVSKYYSASELIVKHSKDGTIGSKPKSNDYIFRILDDKSSGNLDVTLYPSKEYAVNCYDQSTLSYLSSICYKLLQKNITNLNLTPQEIKDKQSLEAQGAALGEGGGAAYISTEPVVQKPREYQKDENEISAVYTQFHHICQAWIALANTSVEAFTGEKGLPSGIDPNTLNLRTTLERVYRNDDTGDRSFFYLNFTFPLANLASSDINIKDAIINSDPLLVNNSDTSTLNMMNAICQKNNFILQPIPGGVTDNIDEIFLAHPEADSAIGGNALSIIWSPTPENRVNNNSDEPIYPEEGWFNDLEKINKPIIAIQYGKPNNAVVKSIKAGTDDNKVTSESLQATNDIVNNTNPNKKKGFDCSMLAVLQGRSYKISLDLIGNAQMYPTQLIAVDGLPIFKGLYWVTEVTHKITPNNMETTIDALKMKYKGGGKFAAVLPITKRSIRAGTSTGNFNVNGTENLGYGGDLNYKFLQLVKDKKITKSDDINPIIKEFTKNKYNDFPTWFNAELAGNKKPLCAASINADNFKKVWDFLIPIVWPDYGTSGCNFLEFVALNAIMYEETGGTYESKHEGMNDVKKAEHPGIAFAYDAFTLPATNGKAARPKSSYNKAPNKTAGELFNDPSYIDAFKGLKFGTDPKVVRSNDAAWKGTTFPTSLFSDVSEAVTTDSTFISQADFYKFAGRGFIGSTWRSQYQYFVKFILTYSGSDSIVRKYQGNWKASPYNGNEEVILTKSTNADWDELFTSGAIQGFAIYTHAKGALNYQYMAPLDKPKEELIKNIEKEAKKVNSGDDYQKVHRTRVYVILDTLYPEGAVTPSVPFNPNVTTSLAPPNIEGEMNADRSCTSVKRGNKLIWIHTGKEDQFFKREVRSITLHFTAGYGRDAVDTVDGVGKCGAKYKRSGIHYAIDWQGKTAAGIPETIYSVHGDNWNNHGIGIEMCNLGRMEPRPDKGNGDNGNPIFYSPAGGRFHYDGQKFMGSIMPPIADLGFIWFKSRYYQEYTNPQIVALEKLIREIFTRYPKIKEAIQGKNLWSTTFRAVDGKPAPGSTPKIPKYPHANMKDYGIFTHWSNSGGDHTDSAPTPQLVAMLKRLGMTE